jgi:hypothetical protein
MLNPVVRQAVVKGNENDKMEMIKWK